ncbi:MAG TPA: Gfo/Idh/MocA family oxidoreductase, partial [Candidatus Limnocylindrales bacterium]|nr:Gfo/Idh/MocA family oxidoreductase [Candidatus Limnocylindrales bacterium]
MENVRLGIIGLGWFGGVLADAAKATGLAETASCFARSDDARKAFAERHGCRAADNLDAMLADDGIDAVVLATPHSTHADLTEQAASAGKHVFVEKPLTLSVAEAKRAIGAAEAAGVVLQVGQNRRRQPANRRIKAMIDGGELGTLLQLEGFHTAAGGHKPDLPAWRRDPDECPFGGMTALGVHTVDTFHHWVGPARRVSAFSTKVAGMGSTDLDEATTVMIEYEGGVLGTIGTNYFTAPIVTTTAYGSEAIVWNEEDGKRFFVQPRTDAARTEQPVDQLDTVVDEMAEFARAIRGEATPET